LREAKRRQQSGESFCGVIFARHQKVSVGKCIEDLEMIVQVANSEDLANRVEYLPL
jgi:hypothetical protein